jgi:hypothetical protein
MPDVGHLDRVSVADAIRHGKRSVKIPMNLAVLLVTLGLVALGVVVNVRLQFTVGTKILLTLLSFLIGWSASGLVWCWLAPRWRLWAYERVDDLEALEASAVRAQLIWPPRHPFGKAEIRPPKLAAKLRPYEDAIWSRIQRLSVSP